MMLLLFTVGEDRYGLDVAQVIEVVPGVPLRRLPRTPPHVAGLFNYRGMAVPVLDMSVLFGDAPSRAVLSTRVILVKHEVEGDGPRLLGLLAERVTEAVRPARDSIVATVAVTGQNACLGDLVMDGQGMIQCIDSRKLVNAELESLLFHEDTRPEDDAVP